MNKKTKSILNLLHPEFLIIFVFGLVFFIILRLTSNKDPYASNIFDHLDLLELILLPILIFAIYKFTKNKEVKKIIKSFFNSMVQPIIINITFFVCFVATFLAEYLYRKAYDNNYDLLLSKNSIITSFAAYFFFFSVVLMGYVGIYQLFTRQWIKGIINLVLTPVMVILFGAVGILFLVIDYFLYLMK